MARRRKVGSLESRKVGGTGIRALTGVGARRRMPIVWELQRVPSGRITFVLFEMWEHACGYRAILQQVRASGVRGATGGDEQRGLSCAGGASRYGAGRASSGVCRF